jgi:hypothetical protein
MPSKITYPMPKKVTFSIEMIGPQEAQKILDLNPKNRHIRERRVQAIATDIINRLWDFNGETIKIATDGSLLDGQHRLLGIIKAGIAVPCLVVRGLPVLAQDNVDTGAKRLYSDVLTMRGEKNTATLAAIARKVYGWENGDFRSLNIVATNGALDNVIRRYPDLRDAAEFSRHHKSPLSQSLTGYLFWQFSRIDTDHSEEDAVEFFTRLSDGQALLEGEAIYTLRKTLEGFRRSKSQMPIEYHLAALTIKAWNAFRDGVEIQVLKFRPGGAKPEPFPAWH